MNNKKQKRRRGIILTREGWQKIQNAKLEWELRDNQGYKITLEELSDRAELTTATLRKILTRDQGVDKRSIVTLFTVFNLELEPNDYTSQRSLKKTDNKRILKQIDWGEAVDVSNFYGRKAELATLDKWLLEDSCRLITVVGMGGIGKTALSVKLAERVKDEYDYIIWRSLRDAPQIEDILTNLIQFLCEEQKVKAELPENTTAEQISLLIECLRSSRCLIILDNCESLLCDDSRAGTCGEAYEEYDALFQRIGESEHQSCLLLTTREQPKLVSILEGETSPVRSLKLNGFKEKEGAKILKTKRLSGSESELAQLVACYNGNALALKIVGTTIRDLFQGNISEFLRQDTAIFGDVRDLLDQQFNRLIDIEEKIMYWLAINREPITLAQIQEDLVCSVSQFNLLEGLESLSRRCLIDKIENNAIKEKDNVSFTLQSVVMEYVTSRLIDNVCQEIVSHKIKLFRFHALMKATAKDYIKNTQIRLIVQPVINNLLTILKGKRNLENRFLQIIVTLQESSPLEPGYTAGNIINLFCHLGTDLKGYDFSNLYIWQADLQNVYLHDVSFQNSDLAKTVFCETFGSVMSVAFSPDGKLIATGDSNGEIYIRKTIDNQIIFVFQNHTNWVVSLDFSSDSRTLASGSSDNTVRFWNVVTGQLLKTLQGHRGEVWSVVFSPDDKLLATGCDDHKIRIWNINTGECIRILQGHKNWVLSVVFSPDGQTLLSGSEDKDIKIWNLNNGECQKILKGHTAGVRSISISLDGQILASSGDDYTIRIWKIDTGECQKILLGHSNQIFSVAFSPKGDNVLSGSHDQTMKLWSISTGKCLKTFQGHKNWVCSVAFSPKGDNVLSGSRDQTMKLWSVSTGECLRTFQGYTNQMLSVAFNQNHEYLIGGGHDSTIKLWEISTGQLLKSFRGHKNWVYSVAISPQSDLLVSGSADKTVKLWEIGTGQLLKSFQGHLATVYSVCFSPDGQMIASASEDCTIKLWDVQTSQLLKSFPGHYSAIWSVAFHPNSQIIASGSLDRSIKLWSISTGKCVKTLNEHKNWVWSVAFSPDGNMLASSSTGESLKLWNISTGKCIKTFSARASWFLSVAFSPDGKKLAASCQDRTIKIWNLDTGECLRSLLGHKNGYIWSIAFSLDNRIIASASEDESIKLWDISTGNCIKTLVSQRPYKNLNCTNVTGVTDANIEKLKVLGSVN